LSDSQGIPVSHGCATTSKADHSVTSISLPEPVVVTTGPPGEVGLNRWGFYQFPDLWRGNDDRLYLAMNVGADSAVGRHDPTQFFVSDDGGKTWARIARSEVDFSPAVIDLPDGGQISFEKRRFIYHYHALSAEAKAGRVTAPELGLVPALGPILGSYEVNEYCHYRYGDIPAQKRQFPASWRDTPGDAWHLGFGDVGMPDLLVRTLTRSGWWDDDGKFSWHDLDEELKLPVPNDWNTLEVLPDGTLLWAASTQNPSVVDRACYQVLCLVSKDKGRTWHLRGTVTDDTTGAPHGYGMGEQALTRMPNGNLLCVMRTRASNRIDSSSFLAACRSSDDGRTWTPVEEIAPFSVTPHLLTLGNGTVVLVYGRPGVHVRVSTDSGITWSETTTVVGPPEQHFLDTPRTEWWKHQHDYSCANTDLAVTGPDRFLLAYSDFEHQTEDGQPCKAIKLVEITAPRLAL